MLSNVTWKVNKHIIFKINDVVSEDQVVSVDYKQAQKQAIIVLKTNEAAAKVFDYFNNQKVEDAEIIANYERSHSQKASMSVEK